jgi:RNA polymerase sigma-70 factor (ECF subfamily)
MEIPEPTQILVEKARGGDRQALDEIASRYAKRLEPWIDRKLGAKLRKNVTAEDLVQETYLRATRCFHEFRWEGEASLWRWLLTIARHAIQDAGRSLEAQKRAPEREIPLAAKATRSEGAPTDPREPPDTGTSASKGPTRHERLQRFQRALESLRPEDREVIILVSVKGIPMKDAAKKIGRSPEATSMLLLRAMRKLKAAFGGIDSTDSLRLPIDARLSEKLMGEGDGHGER